VSTANAARGPGRPPGADGAETRRRILHSARQVFSSTGFDRASLKQIAEDAGVTRNAIANYYPSKAALHAAAFASIQRDAVARILAIASEIDGTVPGRVMALFEAAIALDTTDPSFVRFMITATVDATHHPELGDHSLRQFTDVRTFLTDTLHAGQLRGELDDSLDVGATAQVLVDLLWGLAMDIGFFSDKRRTGHTLRAVSGLLHTALAGSPDPSPPTGQ
jgi:AcrR family transcriptional regulator